MYIYAPAPPGIGIERAVVDYEALDTSIDASVLPGANEFAASCFVGSASPGLEIDPLLLQTERDRVGK